MGIEPTTEGLSGGSNRSDWSGDVGLVQESLGTPSGDVGLVRQCRFGLRDEMWNCLVRNNHVRVRVGVRHPQSTTKHRSLNSSFT